MIELGKWSGTPISGGEIWTLRKGGHVALCELWTHPLGREIRVTIDGEWQRGEAFRSMSELLDTATEWKKSFEAKGWN